MIPCIDLDYQGSSDMTIERAVILGKKLRAQKPSHHRTRELHVANVNVTNNLPNRKYRTTKRKRNNPRKQPKHLTVESFRCQCSSQPRIKQKTKRRVTTRKIVLSMRTAELAVPTKRQCLDTWRHKSYVLPAFMVERLQQYVMDQKPIVQIQDAIYCFKKRKYSNKKFSKYANGENGECKCNTVLCKKTMKEIKSLSAVFAHKIAKKLSPPACISLGPSLNNISEIVSRDIANIIYRRKTTTQSYVECKTVHKEMTNKIVAWIVNILEDASEKRLLEALQELEEEEGPVLDFIDELVDGVVIACEPINEEHLSIKSPESSSEDSLDIVDHIDEQSMLNEPVIEDIQIEDFTDSKYFNDMVMKLFETNWEKADEQVSQHSQLNLSVENTATVDNSIPEEATENNGTMSKTEEQSYVYDTSINIGNETKEISPEIKNSTDEHLPTTEHAKEISPTANYQNTYISEAMGKDPTDLFFDAANNDILSDIQHTTTETLPDATKTITNELPIDILNEIMGFLPITNEHTIKVTTTLVPETEDSHVDEIVRENEILDMDRPKESGIEDEQVIEIRTENELIETIIAPALEDDEFYETGKENEITAMHASMTPGSEDSQVNESPNQNDFDEKETFNFIEILSKTKLGEDLFDDTDKKVKFSDMNVMVNFKTLVELPEPSQSFVENPIHAKEAWSISSDYKFDMNFNAPNLYLLNDVDEVWPADLVAPLSKASSSVSKSISSLGIVLEIDEMKKQEETDNTMNYKIQNFIDDVIIETTEDKPDNAILPIEQKPKEISTDLKMEQNKDNMDIVIYEGLLYNTDSHTTKELTTPKTLLKVSESLSSLSTQSEINVIHSTTADQRYIKNSEIITENIDHDKAIEEDTSHKGTIKALKPEDNLQDTKFQHITDPIPIKAQVSSHKFDINMNKALDESLNDNTFIQNNGIFKAIGDDMCKTLENSTNYRDRRKAQNEWRVQINSAPSWIFDVSHNENLIHKFQSLIDIHKWCRDLDQGYTNLEIWMNWFDDTCRNIIRLQNVVCTPCTKARMETMRTTLLENIKNDGKSWSILYQNNKKILTRHLNSVPLKRNHRNHCMCFRKNEIL